MIPEGWTLQPLSDICQKTISYGIVQTGPNVHEGVPCLRVADLSKKKIDINEMITTSQEINHAYEKTILEEDEIVLALRGEVGLSRLITKELVGANITRGLARIAAKQSLVLSAFLLWELRSPKFRSDLLRRVSGSALQEISLTELRKVETLLPPKSEQIKIAQILSTSDQAIETTGKLIENSKAQKKALMQQLLTGRRRFQEFVQSSETVATKYGSIPADWSFVTINEVAKDQAERAGENHDFPVLSCSKYDGFVDSLQYFKKKVYSDDTSNYKVVRRGCFGFPSNHIEEGSIGYQDVYDAGIVSPIYSVFKTNDNINDDYLYKLLKTDHYRQIFKANTNASVDRRGSLRWKEFGKIRIPLPSPEEQAKIAAVLSTAEKNISNLTQQRQNLNRQKKALMQQLLTGKRRVKVTT